MKKILITAATHFELEPILKTLDIDLNKTQNIFFKNFYNLNLIFLRTGIGVMATIYNLVKFLQIHQIDFAINIGLAGSFNSKKIQIGHTVNIVEEILGDFGAMDKNEFKTIFELGLIDKNEKPFVDGRLINNFRYPNIETFVSYPAVRSLTVCNVSGVEEQIKLRKDKFDADVENMEGAAFFYVMLNEGIPFLEIRAISNIVEPRNKERWNILKALAALQESVKLLIMDIAKDEVIY